MYEPPYQGLSDVIRAPVKSGHLVWTAAGCGRATVRPIGGSEKERYFFSDPRVLRLQEIIPPRKQNIGKHAATLSKCESGADAPATATGTGPNFAKQTHALALPPTASPLHRPDPWCRLPCPRQRPTTVALAASASWPPRPPPAPLPSSPPCCGPPVCACGSDERVRVEAAARTFSGGEKAAGTGLQVYTAGGAAWRQNAAGCREGRAGRAGYGTTHGTVIASGPCRLGEPASCDASLVYHLSTAVELSTNKRYRVDLSV